MQVERLFYTQYVEGASPSLGTKRLISSTEEQARSKG